MARGVRRARKIMNRLRFEIEWEDPAAAVGLELRATWSHLRIFIDDTCLTQVHDLAARSVRNGIYLPLYPLAEWLAMHWWSLFAELENPRRTLPNEYQRRHNLRYGRDGFIFPNLILRPLNGQIALNWGDSADCTGMVRFLSQGSALLSASDVITSISDLIETVIRRLEQSGLQNTLLHQEWQAINSADAKEGVFCTAAAALGLDPYSLDNEVSEAILQAGKLLPKPVVEEFFASADTSQLLIQAHQVSKALARAKAQTARLQPVIDIRRRVRFESKARAPWEDGYSWARQLRKELCLNGQVPGVINDIGTMLGLASEEFARAVTVMKAVPVVFDAVVNLNDQRSPGFVLRNQSQANLKFSFCRALIEYLAAEQPGPALVAADYSSRQKRNRAFAAEFLVPSEELRDALPSDYLGPDELDALARRFKVSSWLVQHQVENHKLARLAPSVSDL